MDRLHQQDIIPTGIKNRHFGNIVLQGTTAKATLSIAANSGAVVTIPTSISSFRNLANPDISLYESSVATANKIPNGANVTASNYQIIGPWNDLNSSDGINTQTKIYIGNVSTSTGSVSSRVGASSDDGNFLTIAGVWNYTDNFVRTGYPNNVDPRPAFRFTNITIPNSATITAATLTLTSDDNPVNLGTIHSLVYGIAEDNTATFTSDPSGRTKTTANVVWNQGDSTFNVAYTSPDISSIVQEIINRAGWTSGNAIGFELIDNDHVSDSGSAKQWWSYDGDPTKGCLLSITYTSLGSTKTVIVQYRSRYVYQ